MATIGVDLGGTKILGLLLVEGVVAARVKRKTPAGGPAAVVAAIAETVARLGGAGTVEAVGVGAPGIVDARRGTVVRAPNLGGWHEPVALGPLLSASLGVPVSVENDVNAAALAEHRLGAGRGVGDLLAVSVGTGVGGGVILDGRLRRGPTGLAGEIGHLVVEPGGRPCGCGGFGHLEAYAGRAAMERQARALAVGGRSTVLMAEAGAGRMTSRVWAAGLAAGDPVTGELVDEAVAALAAGLASAVTLLDLELVVVGGGLAERLGPAYVARVESAVLGQLTVGGSGVRVVPAAMGDLAGAIGAAILASEGG